MTRAEPQQLERWNKPTSQRTVGVPGGLSALCRSVAPRPSILPGKQALKGEHRPCVNDDCERVVDSLDLEAWQNAHERQEKTPPPRQEKKWDYLLSLGSCCFAVEVHPAKLDQVRQIIEKVAAAKRFLCAQLGRDPVNGGWHWLASGNMDIAGTDKQRRTLQGQGIAFPKKLLVVPRDLRDF